MLSRRNEGSLCDKNNWQKTDAVPNECRTYSIWNRNYETIRSSTYCQDGGSLLNLKQFLSYSSILQSRRFGKTVEKGTTHWGVRFQNFRLNFEWLWIFVLKSIDAQRYKTSQYIFS